MKRVIISLCAVLAMTPPILANEISDTPNSYVDEAVKRVKDMAYRSSNVDWPVLERSVAAAAEGATDQIDLLRAYHLLVEGLQDGHSFVQVPLEDAEAFKQRHGRAFDASKVVKQITSSYTGRRSPDAKPLAVGKRNATLLVIPSVSGGGENARNYAQKLFDEIKTTSESSCGYVVDLRGNLGGNVWPMVVGLSPLLGDGWQSYERNREGLVSSFAKIESGIAVVTEGEHKGHKLAEVNGWSAMPRLRQIPVAVLTDHAVASSGEAVAVTFKGRPHTRFFGETTYGAASSNEGFMIAGRVNIVVTTAMMADRNGNTFPDGIHPDVNIPPSASSADGHDLVVSAAASWLAKHRSCR